MKKNGVIAILLLLLLLTQLVLPVAAAAPTETGEAEPDGFVAPPALSDHSFPMDFEIKAKAAVLLDLDSNTILYSHAMDERLYPASLTKIMTCMLALERGDLDAETTVSATALENLSEFGSTANLQEGERITLRELLYCIMLSSANEGCNVIAEQIAGSVDAFVALMNQRAAELGMSATHFANTHGLHDEDHYSTARDLATLAAWAWRDPQFREFSTTTYHVVPATNLSDERYLHTTNYLTSTDIVQKYYYSRASGVKTGFTTPAGGCLISTASGDGLSFMSVVCGCETLIEEDGGELDMRFVETKRLLEFAFDNYVPVQVLASTTMLGQPTVHNAEGRENVVVHAKDNATVLLPADYQAEDIQMSIVYDSTKTLEAPLSAGQRVGTVTAMYQGIALASSDLITLTEVQRATSLFGGENDGQTADDGAGEKTETADSAPTLMKYWYLVVPVLLVLILLAVLLILRAVNVHKAKKRAERRRAMRRRTDD